MARDLLAFVYRSYKTTQSEDDYRPLHSKCCDQNFSLYTIAGLPANIRSSIEDLRQLMVPSLEDVDKAPGYEDVTFEPRIITPPADTEPEPSTIRQNNERFTVITEEDVKEAVIRYASNRCCYNNDIGQNMKIKEITMFGTFHYTLETFTEKREIVWSYDAYGGEKLDTPKNGTAPGPWDIALTPTEQFKDDKWQTAIPHTASIASCYVCHGTGKETCIRCQGCTQIDCGWCNGHGRRWNGDICTYCNGDGTRSCMECDCTGQLMCSACCGRRSLKYYVKLITTWTNHKDEFIYQQTSLPSELLRNISSHVAFEEQQYRVRPVNNFPQHNVNEVSDKLVNKHSRDFPAERILQQRHELRIVPVARVKYTWRDNVGEFFVYGYENKVYFPDYPQTYCCGCVIM